jgi:RimJ/RimL family protein N-acetyltransferase
MARIELDAVVLRALEPGDLPRLHEYRNDPETTRDLVGFSVHYSHAALAAWLESHARRTDEALWAIAARGDDRCIGHVGLYQLDHRIRKASFGILIGDPAQRGKGIGTAVTRAVVDYGFDELNLHRIELDVLATNARAIHIYEGLGFQREGVLRHAQFRGGAYVDLVLMAVLDAEWRR